MPRLETPDTVVRPSVPHEKAYRREWPRHQVDRLMEFRSVESRFPFITTDTLDAVPGGTRYTCRAVGEPMVRGRAGRLLDIGMSKVYQHVLRRHLSKLPGHIDAWASHDR